MSPWLRYLSQNQPLYQKILKEHQLYWFRSLAECYCILFLNCFYHQSIYASHNPTKASPQLRSRWVLLSSFPWLPRWSVNQYNTWCYKRFTMIATVISLSAPVFFPWLPRTSINQSIGHAVYHEHHLDLDWLRALVECSSLLFLAMVPLSPINQCIT